jgi:AcrR family transcriptional regulator
MVTRSASEPRSRSRANHSRGLIVETAIAMLDREGASGLTLRGLAAELGGGLGSVYWHVAGKGELLELACDRLIGRALSNAGVEPGDETGEPVPSPAVEVDLGTTDPTVLGAAATLRRLSLALWDQVDRHPWLAAQAALSGPDLPNGMLVWEHLGRPLAAMGLTRRQQFHGSTALRGYVVGVSGLVASQDHWADLDPTLTKEQHLDRVAQEWRGEKYDGLTWIRSMTDEFVGHDDVEQFANGLDLLILGLVMQARRS